jgi:hypothetical protein
LVPYTTTTSSFPEVPFVPAKVALPALTEAEHDVALDDDQVRVTATPVATEEEEALKFTTGAGLDGATGAEPPPPPPPPQLARINVEVRIYSDNFFIGLFLFNGSFYTAYFYDR